MQNQITMNQLQEEMLKHYIDTVFQKYDTDRNGGLDPQQMTCFFNDLYKTMGAEVVINVEQAKQAIQAIDTDGNGLVDKRQLFAAFQQLLAQNQPMQNIIHYQQQQQQAYQQQQQQAYQQQPQQQVYQQQPVMGQPMQPQMMQQQMSYPQYQQQPAYYGYQQQPMMQAHRPQQPQYTVIKLPSKNQSNRQVYTQHNATGCTIY